MKRIISLLLALVLCFGAIPFFGIEASAATSSAVANAVSNRLPLVTYAMPLSGASKVYSFTNDTFSDKTTSYYIDSFKDQIVITQISADGKAVCVSYPSSSSSTGYRSRWFATDDILGLAIVDIRPYTCSSGNTTYRMSSASAVTSYGSISKNDSCVMLGNHTVGGTTYYPTIYPISTGTYNKVSGVRNKLALGRFAPAKVQPIPNGKYIIVSSLNNNMVLDVSNGSKDNCANIQLWTRNGSGAQIFTVTYNNGGWYTIVNAQSGKALDVANGEAKCGQNVQQYQTNGTNAQKWYLEDAGGAYFYIRSALGYYLDANGGVANNGTNIQIWTGNKSNAQRFKFEKYIAPGTAQYASYSGVDYNTTLKNAYSSGKISSTEYNNRTTLLNEAKKMVTVLWTAPVSFHTWKSSEGTYNSNKAMQYGSAPSSTNQFVKGYTYKGIPYAANAGYNNYNAASWLSLINESGISTSKLEGTVTYLNKTRYNTTFRGIDCSGFVHKAYSTIGSYTFTDNNRLSCSGMLGSSLWKKISASDALPGDILLKSGHVMIYLGKTSNGKIAVFESVADGVNGASGCRYYEFNSVSSYGYYRFTKIAN